MYLVLARYGLQQVTCERSILHILNRVPDTIVPVLPVALHGAAKQGQGHSRLTGHELHSVVQGTQDDKILFHEVNNQDVRLWKLSYIFNIGISLAVGCSGHASYVLTLQKQFYVLIMFF